ncbi:MAG: DUF2842 domain-containing protein [Paracoccus sp. (in: a-proteobacteria)]|nr:DUF2842 domain-containing protein [Paracoccus sp. (in: a-proteobacteria)]MDO5613852.1 DUF2842 domain-containing protein [Paracoccus sp. (in: a-proteobacteria)]
MDLKSRKRWSLVALLIGLPLYLIFAWWLVNWLYDRFGDLPMWVELPLYVVLAIGWVFPLKPVFSGVGRGEE